MGIRGWLGRVARVLGFSESEPEPIDRVFARMLSDAVPQRIGRAEALGVPAVLRGRNLICSISTLPLMQHGPRRQVVDNPLFEQIDPDVANVVTLAQTVEDLLFEGLSWWEIIRFDSSGWPVAAKHRDVGSVTLQPPPSSSTPSPLPGGHDPRGAVVYVDGREVAATSMIRFDSPNPGLLKSAGRPIRRALLLDAAAALYADEPRPMDYFTPAEDADPADDKDIQEILDAWKAARKKRTTAYVPKALRYNTVEQPNPRDLQLVELQRQAALDIANALGIDPEDLGISTTSRTYQNGIDRRQDRINDVLASYMRAITDRLTMRDVTRRGHTVRFDLDDYLRADPLTRWQVYKIADEIGAIEVSEIRAEERLPELPAGRPLPPRRVPAVVGRPVPEVTATAAIGVQLGDDGGKVQFADLPVTEFAVDRERRVISGLALPYGKVAAKYWRKFRFATNAIQWGEVSRVKLLRDHSFALAIGVALELTNTDEGLKVRFKVARGEEGDKAIALAEDGVLDGLSVGVEFDQAVDTIPDPDNEGVTLVRRAYLREVSLTAIPAFDDARVTSVAASRTEGNNAMPCTTCGHVHAEGVACTAPNTEPATTAAPASQPTTLTATAAPTVPTGPAPAATPAPAGPTFGMADLPALLALMQQHGTVGIQQPAAPQQPAPEQRAVVNPIRNGEQTAGALTAAADPTRLTASVTEAAPYRFDSHGNIRMGTHDFSTDLIAGVRDKDDTAARRAMEFVRVQLDATNTTDTGALNPARQRPDLYVDQREFLYPVWDAISKGALDNITPFIFPKFSAASGLVGNHTEGTEPTVGDAAWTSQTVTPTAISGKAEINREVWDQGGNPQVSNLIWRQMTRGWGEALEAAAVALLDAASPTALGTFTTGGGTTGQTLAAELRAALAALHFVRGGFRFTDGFAQIDFYKALTGALDDAGRPLFPAVGPSNADGTVRNRYQAVDVNGLDFLPAWALAASGTVAASSYIFDREAVHGWASAPQRLDFDVQVKSVYIAIWGYKATAISDISGVREISYDPAA